MAKKGKVVTKKMYDSCVSKMLLLTGKKRCKLSRNQIGSCIKFDWGIGEHEEALQFSDIDHIRSKALMTLKKKHVKNVASNSSDFDKFLKKLRDLRGSLRKSFDLMNDKEVKNFLQTKAIKSSEVDPAIVIKHYSKVNREIEYLALEMDLVLDSQMLKGSATLISLKDYVYELASLYQNLSGKKFTILRNVSEDKCEPVTPGHEFVYKAIEILNEESKEKGFESFYSDKNIYNACEEAQKRLKFTE